MRSDSPHSTLPLDGLPVLLFGGTFDPPHRAHVDIPREVIAWLERESGERWHLVFVPAALSPHKTSGPPPCPAEHRIGMLECAIQQAKTPELEHIWDTEIERDRGMGDEPSFWLQTLEQAVERVGAGRVRFLIGADQAVAFHRWHAPREMLAIAEPIVMPRTPIHSATDLRSAMSEAEFWTDAELEAWRKSLAPVTPFDVSATDVRAALRVPRQMADLERALNPSVLQYILAHKLYDA